MYAESYEGEEPSDDDLYPPKKIRPQQREQTAPATTGRTKPIVRPVPASAPVIAPDPDAVRTQEAGDSTHRRRRRSAPSASLQIIRGEQAK